MTATLNGKDVLSLTLNEPRIGVWNAVVDVDSEEAITGTVTLVVDDLSWTGTVVKGDAHAGRVHAQIVGGAGKISSELDTKHYRSASLGTVVDDLMRETGEKLSPTTDPKVRGHIVSRWSRPLGMASAALELVADELGLVWRVLRDGTIWLGEDTWIESQATGDVEISKTPGRDAVLIAPESPHVQPGQMFGGKRVSRVSTTTADGGGLRQEILFESANGGSRVSADFQAMVEKQVGHRIDYSRLYPSKVIRQSGDGSLEILPDAEEMRGNGLTGVPLRLGIPGLSVRLPPGGVVLLFFESGDPKLPACGLMPGSSQVISAELVLSSELTITAPKVTINGNLAVQGDVSALGEVQAHYPVAPVTLSRHLHITPVGNSSPATPGT